MVPADRFAAIGPLCRHFKIRQEYTMNASTFKRTNDRRFTNTLWIASAAVIMACVITPATASAQSGPSLCNVAGNLVQNCGFETGTFFPWIVAWTDSDTVVTTNCAHSGTYCAALGAVPGENSVSQTVNEGSVPAGTPLTVSFWVANGGCCGNSFEAEWNGAPGVLTQISNANAFGYIQFSFQVLSTGGTNDTLRFQEQNPPSYFYLDDVIITVSGPPPVPNKPKHP